MSEPDADTTADPADTADGEAAVDPLRERLLDAAARVFASKGYSGTKIMDIVREAGLSAGAVYGRFKSKNELLMEAVVSRSIRQAQSQPPSAYRRVADVIVQATTEDKGSLNDVEAMQLEAYVAARREPEVAAELVEARRKYRELIQPLVDEALEDGTVGPNGDPESIVFLVHTIWLGLLVQRAAGIEPPDAERWKSLMQRLVKDLGRPT